VDQASPGNRRLGRLLVQHNHHIARLADPGPE
jgi:hypothetical protein